MKKFIEQFKFQVKNAMTEEEKQNIDVEDVLYYEFGIDPTQKEIDCFIKELEKDFKVIKHSSPNRYITIK